MFTKNNALFKGNVLERNPLWCCDESPSPPTGKRVKVVTPILLFMLEKKSVFLVPITRYSWDLPFGIIKTQKGYSFLQSPLEASKSFQTLSNSSPMTSKASVPCWSLSSLSCLYHWTLFTPFSKFYLLGHCSPTEITPIVSSYLSAPSPSSPSLTTQCLNLLLNVVFSKLPPWIIFSL